MAKVVEGFLLGTHYDLTFYLMDGNIYVRTKSSLSRKKVKYSPRFVRTMQSASELGRASKIASRVYRELSREQKRSVFVLYKKMTGVAKLALKYGKSGAEAEREVRDYLVREGVVKKVVLAEGKKKVVKAKARRKVRTNAAVRAREVPSVIGLPDPYKYTERANANRRAVRRDGSGKGPPQRTSTACMIGTASDGRKLLQETYREGKKQRRALTARL